MQTTLQISEQGKILQQEIPKLIETSAESAEALSIQALSTQSVPIRSRHSHFKPLYTHFLAAALLLATGTMAASLIEVFNWVVPVIIISFWVPLIATFVNTQSAVNKIIESGKWQTLNEIQEQIHVLKKGTGFNSAADIETINKLMELHDRVYNARNTRLRITNVFEFLNQLLLPLLAFVISNYTVVLKLFKLIP